MSAPSNRAIPGRSTAPFAFGVTLTVHREPARDWAGDVPDGAVETLHAIPGCSISQWSSDEDVTAGRRDTVTTGLKVHAPPGADVLATDVITLPDPAQGRWQVEGDLDAKVSPFTGWAPGVVFVLVRTTG